MIDKRFIVDYLCKNEDVPYQRGRESRVNGNLQCRARLLIEIALNLGIPEQLIKNVANREQLCDIVNKRIIELDIVNNLAECKKNMAIFHMQNMESADPSLLAADYEELTRWYDNIYKQADQTIKSGNLTKMVELRNQIKGSCQTFTTGLLQKLQTFNPSSPARSPSVSSSTKKKRSWNFFKSG